MKILYDQQIFSFQDYGGISRYFYELASRVKQTNNQVLVDGKYSNNVYSNKLKKDTKQFLLRFNFPHKNVVMFYLNSILDSKNLKKWNFDVLHATYYHPYFLNKMNGRPYVVTVHDLTHELYEKDVGGLQTQTKKFKKYVIQGANHIIAVSENTKNDLVKIYKIPQNKITVIYHGNSFEDIVPQYVKNLPKSYLLYVGNRSGYKNFRLFVKATSSVLKEDNNLFLVCAGGGKFSREENKLLSELKISNQVKQISFKNDNELAYIYKNALVYILPSLYEGFGMTALEAFSMGCPVVASDTSSIPEVCGRAVLYINPENADSIRSGIKKVLDDNKLSENLVKLGFGQVKKFSWKKTTRDTLLIYNKIVRNGR